MAKNIDNRQDHNRNSVNLSNHGRVVQKKRKIDDNNTIVDVRSQKKARLDSLLVKLKRISSDLANRATIQATPTFIENGEMLSHQIAGLNWLITLHDNAMPGILADEMGFGKTLQTIAVIGYLQLIRKVDARYLIVVPASSLTAWENEFRQWCPSLIVVSLHGSINVRQQTVKGILNVKPYEWDVCLTTYEMFTAKHCRWFLTTFRWYYIVLDEGTRIKNEKCAQARVIRQLKAEHRLILTGTPLQNTLNELWNLLSWLLPNEFLWPSEFDMWVNDNAYLGNETLVLDNVFTILKPIILRRLKCDVDIVEPYNVVDVLVKMSLVQRKWYRKILMENVDVIRGSDDVKLTDLHSLFVKLRNCTNHPDLIKAADESHTLNSSGKMIVLDMLLANLKQQNSRVVIASQCKKTLDIIEDYLNLRPEYDYSRLDGISVPIDERNNRIAEFQDPLSNKFVFLLSTRYGGSGVNLTTADAVIIYESDWNPQIDLQAISCVHRIGQTKKVRVFRLFAQDTVDEKMIERADKKSNDKVSEYYVQAPSEMHKDFMLNAVRFGAKSILSNASSGDDSEWDKLVRKDSQMLVDQIFEDN